MSPEDLGKVDGKLFKWTVGAVLGLATTFGTLGYQKLSNEVVSLQARLNADEVNIKAIETATKITNEVVNSRLSRIEDKLDRLLEAKGDSSAR